MREILSVPIMMTEAKICVLRSHKNVYYYTYHHMRPEADYYYFVIPSVSTLSYNNNNNNIKHSLIHCVYRFGTLNVRCRSIINIYLLNIWHDTTLNI